MSRAGSMSPAGMRAGFDMTSQEGLAAFTRVYNARLAAFPVGPALSAFPSSPFPRTRAERNKRKAQRRAKRANRKKKR